jgi:hypothetical protein
VKYVALIRVILTTVCLLSACARPQAVPADFRVTLSSGGGFAGLTTGHHLTADGQLTAWSQRPGQEEQVGAVAQLEPKRMRQLVAVLRGAVGDWQSDGAGNMTSHLQLKYGDSLSVWSWSGTRPPEDAPESVKLWLQEFSEIVASAQQEGR